VEELIMLRKTVERLFCCYPGSKAKAKWRLDFKGSSNVIACSSGFEECEGDREFPMTEACKLFEQYQWIACFHPGIDADILRTKKYNFNLK
jgi:hypothetical protein